MKTISVIACLGLLVLVQNVDALYARRRNNQQSLQLSTSNDQVEKIEKHPAGEHALPEDAVIKVVSIAVNEPVPAEPLPALCQAARVSGWLHCHDATGETDGFEAGQLCRAHGQKLWMYVPAGESGSYRSYSYWICSRVKKSRGYSA